MKVLGISGSPRENGNTEILLKHALIPFQKNNWETKEFFLSKFSIQPCSGCDTCNITSKCKINDDMNYIYDEFKTCDAIIIGSPAYYRNVTAQLKALFDRCYALKNNNPLEGKLGGAISVGKGQDGGQTIALSIIYNFFLSSGMICIPGELNGVVATADKPGDIFLQENRLKQAEQLGYNIIKYFR